MCVHPLPIFRDSPRHPPQDVRSQMIDCDPRQDQKPRVVGEEANVPPPCVLAPANEAVPRPQVARRRRPRHTSDGPPHRPHQILQVLAYRLLVAQVVILLHQAVEQRLFRRAPHQLELDRPHLAQRASGLRGVKRTGGNSIAPVRCSINSKPRHTMSRGAPLAWFHSQASHSLWESLLRLAPGCAAINCRMKTTSAAVTVRPRYRHSARIESSVPEKTLERKPLVEVFLRFASSDSAPYRRGFRVRIARGQQELHLVRLQCSSRPRPGRPPPKTPFGKPLLCNPEPLAVISQDFDRGRIPGAEHEQAPREWVFLQLLPA